MAWLFPTMQVDRREEASPAFVDRENTSATWVCRELLGGSVSSFSFRNLFSHHG